jgi:hypothetical protein
VFVFHSKMWKSCPVFLEIIFPFKIESFQLKRIKISLLSLFSLKKCWNKNCFRIFSFLLSRRRKDEKLKSGTEISSSRKIISKLIRNADGDKLNDTSSFWCNKTQIHINNSWCLRVAKINFSVESEMRFHFHVISTHTHVAQKYLMEILTHTDAIAQLQSFAT